MARQPIVDDLYTRLLEKRDLERSNVKACEVLEQGERCLVLRTRSERFQSRFRQPDPENLEDLAALLPRPGADGILRVDVVSDGVVRVRYAEGDAVPDGDGPMVVGAPPEPTRIDTEASEGGVALTTPAARYEIGLLPLALRVRDASGRVAAEAGGPEKNHFQTWDIYSTGICRTGDGRPLAVECFALRPQEAVFGFGEIFCYVSKAADREGNGCKQLQDW